MGLQRPHLPAAIGEAVTAAELAEDVAGEGLPGALISGHRGQGYATSSMPEHG
jgi:hypothetical protein